MEQTADRVAQEDDRGQEAIRHLAEIAKSAAAQREHEAKMLSVTTGAVTAVRQLLEADARRARLFGWVVAGVGAAATLATIGIAAWIAHSGRDAERNYQSRLLGETSERHALEVGITAEKARADALDTELRRDRDSLTSVRSELSETRDGLDVARAELTVLAIDRARLAEREKLMSGSVTRGEPQKVREMLEVVLAELSVIRDRLWIATAAVDVQPNQAQPDRRRTIQLGTATEVVTMRSTSANTPPLMPPVGVLDCDIGTHACYVSPSGICTRR